MRDYTSAIAIAAARTAWRFVWDEDGGTLLFIGSAPAGLTPNATLEITRIHQPDDSFAPYFGVYRATNMSGFNVSEPAGDTHVYDPTQHRISYFWDFDDPDYVPITTPNIPTAWRNLNVAYGKQVAHVWHTPGTYTVTVYAFDEAGNWGVATFEQVVGNADTVYPGATTICLSKAGNFAGKPTGATECTTIAEVHTAMRTQMNSGNRNLRVLTRAGEDFGVDEWAFSVLSGTGYPGGTVYGYRDNMKGLYLGTFGEGARPIVRGNANGSSILKMPDRSDCRQLVVNGIDFQGPWDSTTETGPTRSVGDFADGSNFVEILFTRCRFDGWGDTPTERLGDTPIFFHDCESTNWANYGAFSQGNALFFVGCRFHMHVDALNGVWQGGLVDGINDASQAQSELGNRHGVGRNTSYESIMSCCSFFSRAGWFPNNNGTTFAPTGEQGCERYGGHFGTGPNLRRHFHIRDRVSYEGGENVVDIGPSLPGARALTQNNCLNFVMDKCLVVGSAGTFNALIRGSQAGVTIRNCYLYRRGLTMTHPNNIRFDIWWEFQADSTDTSPVRIYNNTLISEAPSGELDSTYIPMSLSAGHTYVTENNVVRIINRSSPVDHRGNAFLPLGTDPIAGYVSQHKGGRWNFLPLIRRTGLITESGVDEDVVDGAWVRFPYPNKTGENRGAGNVFNPMTQAQVLANSGQFHQVSAGAGFVRMTTQDGRVAIDFTPDWIRVQNNSGGTWSRNRLCYLLLDLRDYLPTGFVANTGQFNATLPAAIPGAGSAAILPDPLNPPVRDDFLAGLRQGARRTDGTVVSDRQHIAGAFA